MDLLCIYILYIYVLRRSIDSIDSIDVWVNESCGFLWYVLNHIDVYIFFF